MPRLSLPLLIISCLIAFYNICNAQVAPKFLWAKNIIKTSASKPATDKYGNVYIAGSYSAGALVTGATLPTATNLDLVIAKYNSAGVLLWFTTVNGAGNEIPYGITLDSNSNIFVQGLCTAPTLFSSTLFTPSYTNTGSYFLAKYAPNGTFLWVKEAISSDKRSIIVSPLKTDPDGNILITGYFHERAYFGGYQLTGSPQKLATSVTTTNIFTAKFDNNGNILWARGTLGPGQSYAYNICSNHSRDVIVTGFLSDSVLIENTTLRPKFFRSAFVTVYDAAGALKWCRLIKDSTILSAGTSAVSDSQGAVYVGGLYIDSVKNVNNVANTTAVFGYLKKFNATGQSVWVKSFKTGNNYAAGTPGISSVDFAKNGDLIIAGTYYDSLTIEEKKFSDATHAVFIARLGVSSNFIWGKSVPAISGYFSWKPEIACYQDYVFLMSNFRGNILLDNDSITGDLINYNTCLAKLDTACRKSLTFLKATTCNSPYIFMGDTLRISGIYHDTLVNATGCDSIITLNLIINTATKDSIFATICQPHVYIFGNQALTASGIYTRIISNSANCDSVITLSLTLNPRPPIPQVTASTNYQICAGDSVFLTAQSGWRYRWNTGDTLKTLVVRTTGVYKVALLSAAGCLGDSATVTVIVHPRPLLPVANVVDSAKVCPGETIPVLLNNYPGAIYAVQWIKNGITLPADTGISYNAGKGIYQLIYTNRATGCTNSSFFRITEYPQPVIDSLAGLPTVCPGSTVVVYKPFGNFTAHINWFVNKGTLVTANTDSLVVNWQGNSSNEAYIYAVPVSTFNCVGDTFKFPVRINPLLTPSLPHGPNSLCTFSPMAIYQAPQPLHPNARISWHINPAHGVVTAGGNSNTVSVLWSGSGHKAIYYTEEVITADTVCSGNSPVLNVNVLTSPDTSLKISGPQAVCAFDTATFLLNSKPGSVYKWNLATGVPSTDTTSTSISAIYATPGTYTISVIETNDSGCAGTPITKVLVVHPTPVALTAKHPTICSGDSVQLGAGPADTSLVYTWVINNTQLPANVAHQSNPHLRLANSSTVPLTYRYVLQVVNRFTGCRDTASVNVTVNPLPLSTAINDTTVCAATQLALGKPDTVTSYEWLNNTNYLNDPLSANPLFIIPARNNDTIYTFVLRIKNRKHGLCFTYDTVKINVLGTPSILADTLLTVCAGQETIIRTYNTDMIWQWQRANTLLSNNPAFNYIGENQGDTVMYDYLTLTGINKKGCMDMIRIKVLVRPRPTPTLNDANRWVCPGQLTQTYIVKNAKPGSTFVWGGIGMAGIIPGVDPTTAIVTWLADAPVLKLEVTETTVDGCESIVAALELASDYNLTEPGSGCTIDNYPLIIPNVITPGNDGINDMFAITNLQYYPQNELTIFNRFGSQVFNQSPYQQQWAAEHLPPGTYYYMLTEKRTEKSHSGWIQVIK